MGIFTIEKWRCDRCGVVKDERPVTGWPKYELVFTESHDVAAGRSVIWKEVCPSCYQDVAKLMTELSGKEY